MKWQQFLISIFDQMSQEMEQDLKGLTLDDVNIQPSPDTNSIGWLAWHLTRCFDASTANLIGDEQLWIKAQWHMKFNRPADLKDLGINHSPEDLSAFKAPEVEVILGYYRDVLQLVKQYVANLSEADLDKEIDHPRFPTVAARIKGIFNDSYQHIGQIAYIHGLLKGLGWWETVRRT